MKNCFIFFIATLTSLLGSCGSSDNKHKQNVHAHIVKPESVHNTLYFTGTIQPIRESTLTSPMNAVVETIHYHYGQPVKKGDVIVTLNSNELQKQYNDTLTDYLKAKDNFTVAQAKFTGTEELWNAGLLSKNNFLSEKSNLAAARVNLIQTTRKFTEMLEKTESNDKPNLPSLNITEFDKVKQALATKHNLIHLKALSDGVLLYPPKSGEESLSKLSVGSTVKSGQVLALIGDLTGISLDIDIPEVDIDKIHPGMAATITGIALGKQTLTGELVAVNAQASNTNGVLPSFNAVVEVKLLTEAQRHWVKVGMSASIAITIESKKQLLIPIAAVKQETGQALVRVQTKDGSFQPQVVTTGTALADKVVIVGGLKQGDIIAYD